MTTIKSRNHPVKLTAGDWLDPPRVSYVNAFKRPLDIAIVVLTAPLVGLVVFICWAIIRRDGGAGFYKQERVGQDGRVFSCWKLRSMVVDADRVLAELCENDPVRSEEWRRDQKLKDDPRITRIGRFIRSTSIDELPQTWNVLLGDMSIVGPRPFLSEQDALYRKAGGRAYYRLRPGVTGPWQVYGRGSTTFSDRVGYDEWYAGSMGFATDLRLILQTVGVVLRGTGT
ncbi:MAG: sugar transferase [Pseudomonadota bacterium]